MKAAIDTNRLGDFIKGDPAAVEFVQRCSELCVPLVVLGELRGGFRSGTRGLENERFLAQFLASERTSILFPDEDTTHHYATVYSQLRRIGRPVPVNDLWIAALCLQNDLPLFTRDQHFQAIPQLQCL